MTLSLKKVRCKVTEWCENPPWSTTDLDNQNLNVNCETGELEISGGDNVPLAQLGTRTVYRYAPAATPGLTAIWWDADAGAHLDPLEWAGPADPDTGFPWFSTAAPIVQTVNSSTNINDSNSGAGAARAGIVKGWVFLPDGVTHWRDNNTNTGELGMVLTASCCGGALTEQPGGNHDVNTGGADRTLMDPTPMTAGWHYVFMPQSDASAFGGFDLEYSTAGETGPWSEVTVMRPDAPVIECEEVTACADIAEGWQLKPLTECCQPMWAPAGGLDEAAVQNLIDASAPEVPQPATAIPVPDNEVDTAIRTGQVGTSADFARADHNHPIRRQANPGDPVVTAGGNATINAALVLDRWSTEETYEYALRIQVAQPAGNGWGWVNIPTIAGFQQPQIYLGTYRNDSNAPQTDAGTGASTDGASPRGPVMSHEAHHWSSTRRLYLAYFRRDEAITSMFIEPIVRYIRL